MGGVGQVLLTGAAGSVAGQLLPGLEGWARLRLTDRVEPPSMAGAETVRGDLEDAAFVDSVMEGVDAAVHLAANADAQSEWDEVRGPNLEAPVNILAAAARHGVRKLVLASSVHAVGQYSKQGRRGITTDLPVAPCCPYGASKAFVEAAGRQHAYRHDASVICLRFGATTRVPMAREVLPGWFGPEDLAQMIRLSVESEVRFGIYFGVSAAELGVWDIENARRELGYEPHCQVGPYLETAPEVEGWGLCPT
ncbi:MAG TPA: NAD(P)-dependent oxidoreductase [Candidatus Dormibacteraeota bacterium]|jgi:nucleoside-diphosphate-sugar epimerase|nr:NAD(P)-dependent oxidoreductase [Candidatus Dormibacteraeota bacterium]